MHEKRRKNERKTKWKMLTLDFLTRETLDELRGTLRIVKLLAWVLYHSAGDRVIVRLFHVQASIICIKHTTYQRLRFVNIYSYIHLFLQYLQLQSVSCLK